MGNGCRIPTVVETIGRWEESAVMGTALARHKVEEVSEKPRHLYMILYFSFDICAQILRVALYH